MRCKYPLRKKISKVRGKKCNECHRWHQHRIHRPPVLSCLFRLLSRWQTLSGLDLLTLQPGLSLLKLKASQLIHKHVLVSASRFSKRGSNWKRLFPKPVGRIPKTSRFCATVSRHNFCSCFNPEIWRNCCKELLKAASKSTSVNCALHTVTIFVGLGKNQAKFISSCQDLSIIISKLSTVIDSANQILIPGAGIMERRHQWNVYRLPCAFPHHQDALGSSRSP